MRTKKYKKILEDNGYRYYENNYSITARKYLEEHYDIEIKVGKLRPGRLEVNIKGFCGDESDIILEAMELAETPLEDREEKKFYLRHRWINAGGYHWYLSRLEDSRIYKYDLKEFDFGGNTDKEFTLTEIDELKEKYNTDLKDFELVEVKDE